MYNYMEKFINKIHDINYTDSKTSYKHCRDKIKQLKNQKNFILVQQVI